MKKDMSIIDIADKLNFAYIGLIIILFPFIYLYQTQKPSETKKTADKTEIKTTTVKSKNKTTTVRVEKRNVVSQEDRQTSIVRPRFSIGAGVIYDVPSAGQDQYLTLGVRAVGDLWLETGYQVKHNSLTLGIKYEL